MQISLILAILLLLSSVASGRVPLNWREAKLMVFRTRALSIFRLQVERNTHFPKQLQPEGKVTPTPGPTESTHPPSPAPCIEHTISSHGPDRTALA